MSSSSSLLSSTQPLASAAAATGASAADMNAPMRMSRHDTSTYWGRVFDFQERINPLFLLVGEEEARESERIASLAKQGKWKELRERGIDEKKLQEFVLIAQSTINASDGSLVHPFFRLAAFCPVNIPISGGMILSAPTFANSVFWQWINQTYNAGFNWANGNRSPTAHSEHVRNDIIKGYASAVFVSVGLAVCLNGWLARSRLQGVTRKILQAVVPYAAVASANFGNTLLMRGQEIKKGIPVYDADKMEVGVSKNAALQAVVQTAISRVVLPLPVLLLPYPIMSVFNALLPITRTNAFLKVGMELSVIFGCLCVGLPLAVGMFPEYGEMDVKDLEPELQKKLQARLGDIQKVYFNKGV
ncbi:tricarboxylate carrier protein [Besnoitia besnoiti]|uniref:Tricarboxylate carrier protein n=1 Tax=Besnoitia besnoiti TaxID=94643 RepID=A0A2A9MH71_BESBE|nr:tricarboxylate carrier protein [Besnoitia besnoiti]PFH34752.1 tricarboxylate carrier protein [Besnoitia besnoiti]